MAWGTYKALRPTEGFFKGTEPTENETKSRTLCRTSDLSCNQGFEAFLPSYLLTFFLFLTATRKNFLLGTGK
jgi:hypothetical protein